MSVIIRTQNVKKSFPLPGREPIEVLKGVDFEAENGQLTILKGRSVSDVDTSSMSMSNKEKMRRKDIGFVFQSVALVPIMSAYENVDFALRLSGYEGDRDRRIKEVLSIVGLEKRMHHMPSQMSGGEQQRVAIARAVSHRPKIIFADEPTGALDTATGLVVIKLFKELIERENITIVMTTHDPNLMDWGDSVYEMEDGELSHVK